MELKIGRKFSAIGIMFLTAIAIFARARYQLFAQTVPTAQLMSEISILALTANLIFLLLICYRNDNINMSSVWLCSRIGNKLSSYYLDLR